jgi:hypothetical protein
MIKRTILVLTLAICILVVPLSASAFDPFQNACNVGGSQKSAVCTDSSKPIAILGSNGIIVDITHIFAILAGIAAVIIIIVGGIRYTTSGGESGKVESAKNTVVNALIGVAVIVLAQALITYVVSRL